MNQMPYRKLCAALLLALFATGAWAAGLGSGDDFLLPNQAFELDTQVQDDGTVLLHWDIAPDYYMYRGRFKVKGSPDSVQSVKSPAGKQIHDEYLGDVEIYRKEATLRVRPGEADSLRLTWQGCADAGLCYPPQHKTVHLEGLVGASSAGSGTPPTASGGKESASLGSDQTLATQLATGGFGWALLVFFGLGLLLTFTPCVLPMVPILSSVIVGSHARGLRGFSLALAFVLPMAVTYAVLGVVSALLGANLQALLQAPPVLIAFALVFAVLALAMFGVFELQLPRPLRERLTRLSERQRGGHIGDAAAMGVVSAVLVSPCMTAPLAGALLYIADTGNALLGGSALLSLGLGMGVPLLIVGTVGAQILPRPGPWMNAVKTLFGFVLLGTALWFLQRILPGTVMLVLWGALLLLMGLSLWKAGKHLTHNTAATSSLTAAALLSLWGVMMVIGAAGGADTPLRPLGFLQADSSGKQSAAGTEKRNFMARFQPVEDHAELQSRIAKAQASGQWTLVDFYADWCISCKEIERRVFSQPRVQQALSNFQLLRPDVTAYDNADQRLMQKLGVMGPPTILFIGPEGGEKRASRIIGEVDAEAFLTHLKKATGQSS